MLAIPTTTSILDVSMKKFYVTMVSQKPVVIRKKFTQQMVNPVSDDYRDIQELVMNQLNNDLDSREMVQRIRPLDDQNYCALFFIVGVKKY